MTPERFEEVLQRRINLIKKVLGKKAEEYAKDKDRLYNFKVAASMDLSTPEKICWQFMLKHLVCVRDLVYKKTRLTREIIDEKLGDAINYLILLEGLLVELLEKSNQEANKVNN